MNFTLACMMLSGKLAPPQPRSTPPKKSSPPPPPKKPATKKPVAAKKPPVKLFPAANFHAALAALENPDPTSKAAELERQAVAMFVAQDPHMVGEHYRQHYRQHCPVCHIERIPKVYNKRGAPKKTENRRTMTAEDIKTHLKEGMSMRAMAFYHGMSSATICRVAKTSS